MRKEEEKRDAKGLRDNLESSNFTFLRDKLDPLV